MRVETSNIKQIYNTKTCRNIDTSIDAKQHFDDISDEILLNSDNQKNSLNSIIEDFKKIQEEQGLIGKTWNGIKCLFGGGSKKIIKQIEKAKNGELPLSELKKKIEDYKKGQEMSVDVVGDLISGIAAIGAIFAAPVTGGMSLLLAAGVGAGVKTFVKSSDAIFTKRNYGLKDISYDLVTGSINGMFAPITNALGGVVGTSIAKFLGLNSLKSAVFETGAQSIGKSFLSRFLSNQGIKYIAKEGSQKGAKTLLSKAAVYGADMAANGSVTGAADSFARSIASGDFRNLWKNIKQGFIGGLIAAPVIGGGFKAAGKIGANIKSKIGEKVSSQIEKPTFSLEIPDIKKIKSGLSSLPKGAKELLAKLKKGISANNISQKNKSTSFSSISGKGTISQTSVKKASALSGTSAKNAAAAVGTSDLDLKIISSVKGTIYEDSQKFAEHLEQQFIRQFGNTSEKEIKEIISAMVIDLGISESAAREVLSRITQFTSYSQIREMGKALEKLGIKDVFKTDTISLNNTLKYIGFNKRQFFAQGVKKFGKGCNKEVFFLDNNSLTFLRNIIDNPNSALDFLKKIKHGEIVFAAVDGWNIKSNGRYVSYGFAGQDQNLASITKNVLERMKRENISLDEALNGDFMKEAKTVLSELFEKAKIKQPVTINTISNTSATGFSVSDIAGRIKGKGPSLNYIKATIDALVDNAFPNGPFEKREAARILLSKYFDKMLSVNSSESLAAKLRAKFSAIQAQLPKGKTVEDIVYIVPTSKDFYPKSFESVCYQYSRVNNIPIKKFIRYDGTSDLPEAIKGKVCVILDDIVGSGDSLLKQHLHYESLLNKISSLPDSLKPTFIFSPISTLKSGQNNILYAFKNNGRSVKDLFIPNDIVDYDKFLKELSVDGYDANMLSKILYSPGYGNGHAVTGMPYMLPDNNTDATGLLLRPILSNINGDSSKCSGIYSELLPRIRDKLKGIEIIE